MPPPYCGGRANWPSSAPPFAAITRCEARLSRSAVRSTAREPDGAGLVEEKAERAGGVAAAALPGDDRVADVAEDVRRQLGGAGLPAEVDRAGELAVPDPAGEAGEPRHAGAVGELDRGALRVAAVERGEEGVRVGRDAASCSAAVFGPRTVVSGDQPRRSASV